MSRDFDYYAILGVSPKATTEEIQAAFVMLRSAITPELRDEAKNPEYHRLLHAYEVLNDADRRQTYDSLIAETSAIGLNVEIKPSRDKISMSDNNQLVYLLINVRPPKLDAQQRPLNLSLVIDRSTSMQGERLACVKTAVDLLVEKLGPEDILSIVSFSDRAEVVVPSGRIENKVRISGQVRGIQASGGTEIYQGLITAVQELRKANLSGYTNQLILLTDGHTYGDAAQCLNLARQIAGEGIGLSAFGLGSEWNDSFLDKLVTPSGGQSNFIEDPNEIINHLQKRIKGLGAVYAQNLRMKNSLPKFVKLQEGFKLAPFAQPLNVDDDEIQLGDVESRTPLAFLLELSLEPQTIETRISLPITLIANIPSLQMREQTYRQTLPLYILAEAPRILPPDELVKAVHAFNMHRMNEKVWEEVEAGRLDVAATRMHHLTTRLLEAGETALAHQATMELERLNNADTMSTEGRKRLKYGTRALIDRTVHLDQDD